MHTSNKDYYEASYDVVEQEINKDYVISGNVALREWLNKTYQQKDKPYLIKTDYYGLRDKKAIVRDSFHFKQKRMDDFSFLLNSSIWLRLVDNIDKTNDDKNAIKEFRWFKKLGLYDFKSAKEYIEYQLRIQRENYLDGKISQHGAFITPMIYSNEVEYRNFFLNITDPNNPYNMHFKFLGGPGRGEGFQRQDVALRILLIDDKIGKVNISEQNKNKVALNCPNKEKTEEGKWGCDGCSCPSNNEEPCKLQVIKKLLSGDFISENKEDKTKEKYNKRTYWADKVHSYCVDTLRINELWNKEKKPNKNGEEIYKYELVKDKVKQISEDLEIKKDQNGKEMPPYVQIIGVRDLESALALMSCCKFDIILLDYLLGMRSDTDDERYYSTELFEFLSYDFRKPEEDDPDVIKMLRKNNKIGEEDYPRILLEQFRNEVKLNRGPLDKYWIVPMTSYNSSFLADLQRRNVRLIDHRWNISQGADPINTPWRFLYKLNEFVDLQLRQSVFWKSQLITFLQYTGEDLEEYLPVGEGEQGSCFDAFQQFMGAEYANFMKRYGARKLIERDAATAYGDNSNKSMFATYIKEKFYNEPNYYIETELNQLMQHFYHQAATMFDERYGRQRLREAFERMRVFVAYNKLENEIPDTEKGKLIRGLRFIHTVIDSEFNREIIYNWIKENPKTE